jgi:hypothetical protein
MNCQLKHLADLYSSLVPDRREHQKIDNSALQPTVNDVTYILDVSNYTDDRLLAQQNIDRNIFKFA